MMKVRYEVNKALVLGRWSGEWSVTYICDGRIDQDVRGTCGMGIKLFPTREKAEASGKRYVKKMVANGFEG